MQSLHKTLVPPQPRAQFDLLEPQQEQLVLLLPGPRPVPERVRTERWESKPPVAREASPETELLGLALTLAASVEVVTTELADFAELRSGVVDLQDIDRTAGVWQGHAAP